MRGPFKQVVLKAIAGITALEGAPRDGEVVVFLCLAQVASVRDKQTSRRYKLLGEYRGLASIDPPQPVTHFAHLCAVSRHCQCAERRAVLGSVFALHAGFKCYMETRCREDRHLNLQYDGGTMACAPNVFPEV